MVTSGGSSGSDVGDCKEDRERARGKDESQVRALRARVASRGGHDSCRRRSYERSGSTASVDACGIPTVPLPLDRNGARMPSAATGQEPQRKSRRSHLVPASRRWGWRPFPATHGPMADSESTNVNPAPVTVSDPAPVPTLIDDIQTLEMLRTNDPPAHALSDSPGPPHGPPGRSALGSAASVRLPRVEGHDVHRQRVSAPFWPARGQFGPHESIAEQQGRSSSCRFQANDRTCARTQSVPF